MGTPTVASQPNYEEARDHLRRADPTIARLVDTYPDFDPRAWLTELPSFDCFGALLFQVIGQQLSVAATRRILAKLQERFNGLLPTAEQFVTADTDQLRKCGLSRRKVVTLKTVAANFVDGTLSDQRLAQMSDEGIQTALTEISGIGPWTVHGFLIVALNRPDVVLPGDLALRKALQKLYGLDHMPDEDEVLRIADKWRPYRSLATAYVFQEAFDTR